jgi:hypothetical protein
MGGKTGTGKAVEKIEEKKPFVRWMKDYPVTLVDEITFDYREVHPIDGKTSERVIVKEVPLSSLNQEREYDFRVRQEHAGDDIVKGVDNYFVIRKQTPPSFLEMIERASPAFVRLTRDNHGFGMVYVAAPTNSGGRK